MQQCPTKVSAQCLAEMFHQNMSLSDISGENTSHKYQKAAPVEIQQQQASFKYSISQHYTHSAHVLQTLHPLQPSKQDTATRTLIKNGIPPSSLLRSQLTLFEEADEDQRNRLIQLWRIVPRTYARNGGQEMADRLGGYQTTTLLQEEELARLRYMKEARGRDTHSRRADGVLEPAFGYHSSTAPGQSYEGDGSWANDLGQQLTQPPYAAIDQTQHFQGHLSPLPASQDVDEEML